MAKVAMDNWKRQYQAGINGESFLPSEKFSNFAIELATRYRGVTMRAISNSFNDFYDLVQGKGELDMFSGANGEPMSAVEAARQVFDVELKPRRNEEIRGNALDVNAETGTAGRRGEQGDVAGGEPEQTGAGSSERRGGASSVDEVSPKENTETAQAEPQQEQPMFHKVSEITPVSEQESALRDFTIDWMKDFGIDLSTDWEKDQRVLDAANGRATLSRGQKRLLDTAPLIREEGSSADISSSDGAKVVKNLDTLASELEKISSWHKKMLSEIADAHGSTVYTDIMAMERDIIAAQLSKGGNKRFTTFYTNRKTSQSARKTHSEEARDIDNSDVSGAKLQKVSEYDKAKTEKIFDTAKSIGSTCMKFCYKKSP